MKFKVNYNGQIYSFSKPVSILDIVGNDHSFVCAKVNKRLRELTYQIDKNCDLEILTTKDKDARYTYEASLRYVVAMAINNIDPQIKFRFSYNVSRSIFIEFINNQDIANKKFVKKINQEVKKIISNNYEFTKSKVSIPDAIKIYEEDNNLDKINILEYRPENRCHIYTCNGYRNYMYNKMVPSTGYITKYNIIYYPPGIIIQYPRADCDGEIPHFNPSKKFGKTLKKAHIQQVITSSDTIYGLNKRIEKDGEVDVISLSESLHDRQFTELANNIEKLKHKVRIICVAGPSSSGKTTFANRLRIVLLSRGLNPIRISLDDYYKNRSDIPQDTNGKKDFETVDALNISLFKENMLELLKGNETILPVFDFLAGVGVLKRKVILKENQPIIIEGIHALNDKLTKDIPPEKMYKIFISPTAQMNLDNQNPLPLTELRLLRRIVRDNKFRGFPIKETISMWDDVRKAEFKWIYETQENADYVFNSFLPYELCVLKKHAMPLLKTIAIEDPEYPTAERIIRMLKYFINIEDTWVPCNSIIREFIGGSCFKD